MALRDGRLLRQQCYLDGNWVDADNGAVEAIRNPASSHKLGSVPTLGRAETRRAIAAAVTNTPTYSLRIGTLRQRAALQPHRQIWCRSALPWSRDLHEIARFERQ